MEAAPDWILSTINGKIASVSLDYGIFAEIAKKVSRLPADTVSEIRCSRVSTQDVIKMSKTVQWDDMWLFGTDFQKTVWKRLFELSHPEGDKPCRKQLLSYSEFAGLCGKSSGVRAVAHAVAQNPVAIIIPCHLIVPKEAMDRIEDMERQADNSLFGRDGLIPDPSLDFGEYRYGKQLKKMLILYYFRTSLYFN